LFGGGPKGSVTANLFNVSSIVTTSDELTVLLVFKGLGTGTSR
jgi:hypothetical protein